MHAITWFEIPALDFERACRFYETLFGISLIPDDSVPGMRMAIWPGDAGSVRGAVVAMQEARPHADGVRIYLDAGPSLATPLARLEAAGGALVMPPMFISDVAGHIALIRDTEGNIIGLNSVRA